VIGHVAQVGSDGLRPRAEIVHRAPSQRLLSERNWGLNA